MAERAHRDTEIQKSLEVGFCDNFTGSFSNLSVDPLICVDNRFSSSKTTIFGGIGCGFVERMGWRLGGGRKAGMKAARRRLACREGAKTDPRPVAFLWPRGTLKLGRGA